MRKSVLFLIENKTLFLVFLFPFYYIYDILSYVYIIGKLGAYVLKHGRIY